MKWPLIDLMPPSPYISGMSSVADIEAVLPDLTTAQLQELERALHRQFRARHDGIVYDDAHGVTTEGDLIAAADDAFLAYDEAEKSNERGQSR
jgi:hypothetical protein